MWKNAINQECVSLCPEQCGWVMRDTLEPVWFEGNPTPLSVDDILKSNLSENLDKESEDSDDSVSSSDSDED